MRFALLGEHSDGLGMTRALVASGRHELVAYTGPRTGADMLRKGGLRFQLLNDMEELLADPSIEAVIVGGTLEERATQLRRALQSERHVLCVHPADDSPDIAYEAAMIQGDTRCVLLPLLPDPLHPAIARFRELVQADGGILGALRLIEMERASEDYGAQNFALPGWDVLRALGGEIAEVSAFAAREEWAPTEPLLLTGRFEQGALFRSTFLPGPGDAPCRLAFLGAAGRAELLFPNGWEGPARLSWNTDHGEHGEEAWEAHDLWADLVLTFEDALSQRPHDANSLQPTWQTAVRALELDDAGRRSVRRRRVSTLEYPEASEEVGFKGTMTLVGCALLWIVLLLAILSHWVYWLGWLIIPVLLFFLGMQLLRWVVPGRPGRERRASGSQAVVERQAPAGDNAKGSTP
jgi:predicted dehydrogenase